MWYWFFKFVGVGPVAWWYFRMRWTGRENIPRTGPVILAANHVNFLDPVGVSMGAPRKVVYAAKSKYYAGRGLGGRLLGWFLRAIGQLPIDPESAKTADPALAAARDLLEAGGVVAIFPEGTRSPDGRLHRGHTGVARVALPREVPIVPVGVLGTRGLTVKGKLLPRRGHIRVTYGAPLDLTPWRGRADDPQAWREVTDEVMRRIQELTGQEYVDRYPTRAEIDARDA